ncbi:Bcr/CflA family efflux MFS transporter [Pseudooceanicola sp. 216_PA32_1]|uniref:Bcr/CflA family efflux transporter n=1 Tax=Pseudooceanicola pacificus TaxID=2676438 RepID=A0A844W455_9RHOB|nr:multidrug effflux MFS transporter [Pseudooceanicola pacificus]MWB77845.1 Bcr/CflA family efflux MFS transporter [Pseudooceanicola pacificus]
MENHPPVRYLDRLSPPHLSTLILITGLAAMSMNVFLPSLPNMVVWFDAPYHLVQLSVAGFLAANAVLQVFIGPVADKFGRRPVILAGLAIFCLATLGCLLARDIGTFLLFRMIQASVAVCMALSRAVVRDMNAPDRAASMMGYVTMGMALVPMLAPAVGGMLDSIFGWRGSFWLMLASGLAILALTWADLGETGSKSGNSLMQQFGEYPELLTSPRFWGYCLAAAFSSGAFFAYLGGAPFVASNVFGLSPAAFGLWTGIPGIGYFAGNFVTGLVATRIGVNRMIMCGSATVAAGMIAALALSYAGLGGPAVFFGSMFLVGVGNGMTIPSANSGMLSVRPHLAGTAAGLGGAIMIGGGAGLSVLAGLVLQPGRGEYPLIWLMFATAIAGVCSIMLVIWRERQIGISLDGR